jgi:hypothetical protein
VLEFVEGGFWGVPEYAVEEVGFWVLEEVPDPRWVSVHFLARF